MIGRTVGNYRIRASSSFVFSFSLFLVWMAVSAAVVVQVRANAKSEKATSVVLSGGTLIDVLTGEELKDSVIVVLGDRIQRVGKAGEVSIPRNAQAIDAHGKWIIPGLMDMHTHIAYDENLPLELYLASGVTTIRDVGGSALRLRLTREKINSGKKVGPRLFFTGWALEAPLADTPKRAESAVNYLIDQGADAIKVYNDVTEPVLEAIIRTAHRHNIPVIGHVPRSMTMTRAVQLGMDCLEHIRITGRELLPIEEADKIDFLPYVQRENLLWQQFDLESDKMKRLVSFLAEKKVFLDPTLVVEEIELQGAMEGEIEDPNNRFLPRELFDKWAERARHPDDMFKLPPELKEASVGVVEKRKQFVGMCSRAGVQIIAGTDGPLLGRVLPGFGLHQELESLVESGLTPLQAIQAATINAARALRKDSELGSIETGKFADIVILRANPLEDIRNTREIHRVIKNGQIYNPVVLLSNRHSLQSEGEE